MKQYGVIGYPLKHSLSPLIHNYAIQKLNLDASYQKIEIQPEQFERSIAELKKSEISGFNVTIPFKELIIPFVDDIDVDAAALGAVNTIIVNGGRWQACNTDVAGFIAPLKDLKRTFTRCLVLGAGGAARAVIYALGRYFKPATINIAARDKDKSLKLSEYFKPLIKPTELTFTSIRDVQDRTGKFDLIINTTPLGTYPETDQTPLPGLNGLATGTVVYDLVYNPVKTLLLKEAGAGGEAVITINGMKMLLAQAAEAFKLWTGKNMPVEEVGRYMAEQFGI